MDYPTFSIAGHRGAMALAPENSRRSFVVAEESGATEIELDVRCTAEGVLIVLHDETLDRVAADDSGRGLGLVAELSFERVKSVVLDSGEPVLTLEEAYAATTVTMQVELKDRRSVPALSAFMSANPHHAARTFFTSFDEDALHDAYRLVPQVPRGIIVPEYPAMPTAAQDIAALLERTGSDIFHCGWRGLTQDVVDAMHEAGLGVRGWPVHTPDDMRRAIELGVDGITSDDPGLAWTWHQELSGAAAS